MRQLVRILVKLMPRSLKFIMGGEENGGGNKITESQVGHCRRDGFCEGFGVLGVACFATQAGGRGSRWCGCCVTLCCGDVLCMRCAVCNMLLHVVSIGMLTWRAARAAMLCMKCWQYVLCCAVPCFGELCSSAPCLPSASWHPTAP
jgi:hypothetical protein